MLKQLLIMQVLFTCISCSFSNYDEMISKENEAANSGEPGVTITYPSNDEYIRTLDKDSSGNIVPKIITLRGYANDGYGNPVDDSSLKWSSDIAGKLGNGRELVLENGILTPGTHRITLSAVDSWGKKDSRTVSIHIPHLFTEDFNEATFDLKSLYCNLSRTTGCWDTEDGTIHLGPYLKYESPGRCYTGQSYDIAVKNGFAYIAADDDGIIIADIKNKTTVATRSTDGRVLGVALSEDGNYAYFTDIKNGIHIYDISIPGTPVFKTTHSVCYSYTIPNPLPFGDDIEIDVPLYAANIAICGNYAYVADDINNLLILDISNRTSPEYLGIKFMGNPIDNNFKFALGIAVSGNYAYVADAANGLVILDVSDKTKPEKLTNYNTLFASGVAVSGNYAYIADSTSGLIILDVSVPGSPVFYGKYNTDGEVLGVAVKGNYAYAADSINGLLVFDISNPANPLYAGRYNTAGAVRDVAVSGNYAYLADYTKGVYIVNIWNPENLPLIGTYNTYGQALAIAVKDNFLYVADGANGLVIVDITNPVSPIYTKGYNTTLASGIALSGDYAYIADYTNGLIIADISSPVSIPEPVKLATGGQALGVAVAGNYAYVADGSKGLFIADITNPAVPLHLSTYDTDGTAAGVALSGNYAYVADSNNGLVIIDVSNPQDPEVTGHYSTTSALGVAVKGNYAYIADRTSGLVIADISNPVTPAPVSTYNTGGTAKGITVSGNYAYVAGNTSGLIVLDISDPSLPVYAGSHDTISASGITVNANYAFVADLYEGIQIIGNIKPYCALFNTNAEQQIRSNPIPLEIPGYSFARFYISGSNSSQFLLLEMSHNNGSSWIPVGDTLFLPMPDSEKSLIWRARMNSINRYVTPVVDKLCIEYWE